MQYTIIHKDITTSTNTDARDLARFGASAGTVVVAREQCAGHGQWKRVWVSPRGGLYFSCVLKPQLDQALWPTLSERVAHAVMAGIAHACDIDEGIMWVKKPNDIVCAHGKLSGILLEAYDGETIIVGCGVNVARPDTDIVTDGRNVAAYVQDYASNVDASDACLDRFLMSILDELSPILSE